MIASLISLLFIQIDSFYLKEIITESIFDLVLSLLLAVNVARQLIVKLYFVETLSYIVNGLMILICVAGIPFLLFLFWGFSFMGKSTNNLLVAIILCVIMILVALIETRSRLRAPR